jgi:hypothetical protein
MGERLGGFIYGTIVALSVVVAGAKAYPDGPGHVAALVAVTCLVFWIAHVYAHALGHSAALGEHLSLAELGRIGAASGRSSSGGAVDRRPCSEDRAARAADCGLAAVAPASSSRRAGDGLRVGASA